MHYWREDYFDDLRTAGLAAEVHGWPSYAEYCREQEKGLRSLAFAALGKFVESLQETSSIERRRFVSWLLCFAEERKGRHMLIPYSLQKQVVEPTLLEWEAAEPNCSEPHRWLGGREHLERALELDAGDQVARKRLILLLLSWVDYTTHELPYGYLGSASDDLEALARADMLLSDLRDEESRVAYAAIVAEERAAIAGYLAHSAMQDRGESEE